MLSGQWSLTSLQEHQPCLGGWWERGRWEWGGGGVKLVGGGIGPQGVMHPVGGSRAPGKQATAGASIGTAMNLHVALSLTSLSGLPSGERPLGAATVPSLAVQPSLTLCSRCWSNSELPTHAAPLAWMPFSIVCLCLTKLEL